MLLLYNLGIKLYGLIIWIIAPFNKKAKFFFIGRKNIFTQISNKINCNEKHIWFHFASLGEFEQGRPVLEQLKTQYPTKKIIITFFSPSGYEIRKNYALADGIFYLPLDSKTNAQKLIKAINPEMAIFTKYEFWHYYFAELKQQNIPLYIISGIFRKDQVFFKRHGGFYRNILKNVSHFFVQNEESVQLLKSININEVSLSGDTRFDRVYENAQHPKQLNEIKAFCEDKSVLVCGSTWPEDENLLAQLAIKNPDWKFILAPHEIHSSHIESIVSIFSINGNTDKLIKYSNLKSETNFIGKQVLIIDNIGMLSSLYQYGKIAYIGGGFGAGIHNTLEAVAFGSTVIFGPKYQKFQEAKDLLSLNVAKSVNNMEELTSAFNYFKTDNEANLEAKNYIDRKIGATNMILKFLFK